MKIAMLLMILSLWIGCDNTNNRNKRLNESDLVDPDPEKIPIVLDWDGRIDTESSHYLIRRIEERELAIPEWLLGDWEVFDKDSGEAYRIVHFRESGITFTGKGYKIGGSQYYEDAFLRHGFTEINTKFHLDFVPHDESPERWEKISSSLLSCLEIIGNRYWSLDVLTREDTSPPRSHRTFTTSMVVIVDETKRSGLLYSYGIQWGIPDPKLMLSINKL